MNHSGYLDFELNISDLDGDAFTVFVRSAAGEVRETAKFPYGDADLERVLLQIENAILRSTEAHRASQVQREETVEVFGRMLFDFVLPGEARSLYNECMREATHRHRGVRLKLSIHSPRLAMLPWEFLYDPRKRDYICLNPYTPLVRYTELPQATPPLTIGTPLRILGLISDPDDMPMRLDVEQERERVSNAIQSLEERGLVELTWLETNNWRELQRMMRSPSEGWHIFHFIGHGGYDRQRNEGYIMLGNDDGTSHQLYASQLARLLARQYSSMRLVLLNACDGARSGVNDTLSSTAATLINSGIPAVLAMQYEITNDAAVEFANAFYEALADNFPVDAAVAEARNAISLSDARSLEWGVPVLHMRAEDGQLFSITDADQQIGKEAALGAFRAVARSQYAENVPAAESSALAPTADALLQDVQQVVQHRRDRSQHTGRQQSDRPSLANTKRPFPADAPADTFHNSLQSRSTPPIEAEENALTIASEPSVSPTAKNVPAKTDALASLADAEYVSEAELTTALSAAIAEHGTPLLAEEIIESNLRIDANGQWTVVVDTIDALDETVLTEVTNRLQRAVQEPHSDLSILADIERDVHHPLRVSDPQMVDDELWEDDIDEPDLYRLTKGLINQQPADKADAADQMHKVRSALADRQQIFTERVDLLDERALLKSYAQRQHTVVGFDWVAIPAGEFFMGSDKEHDANMFEDEAPQFKLYLDRYQIARYPVTNAQYKLFVTATGYTPPPHWLEGHIPDQQENHPIVNVSWHDAIAFCEWAGVRLPTEAEWEKAARGSDGRVYPWGNEEPNATHCNFNLSIGMTMPVGSYPAGASPYGLCDMAGNVWEWTASVWLDSYENYEEEVQNNAQAALRRVLRGGGFRDIEFVRCASRSWDLPNQRYRDLGFRVVAL